MVSTGCVGCRASFFDRKTLQRRCPRSDVNLVSTLFLHLNTHLNLGAFGRPACTDYTPLPWSDPVLPFAGREHSSAQIAREGFSDSRSCHVRNNRVRSRRLGLLLIGGARLGAFSHSVSALFSFAQPVVVACHCQGLSSVPLIACSESERSVVRVGHSKGAAPASLHNTVRGIPCHFPGRFSIHISSFPSISLCLSFVLTLFIFLDDTVCIILGALGRLWVKLRRCTE